MTKLEFLQCMAYIGAGVQKAIPAESVDVYFELLGDLTVEQLRIGCRAVMLNHTIATFPTVAEIRTAALEASKPDDFSGGEAWSIAWKAAGRIDPEVDGSAARALAKIPPLIAKCMRLFGINSLCYADKISVARAQFLEIYRAEVTKERKQAALPGWVKQEREKVIQQMTDEQKKKLTAFAKPANAASPASPGERGATKAANEASK